MKAVTLATTMSLLTVTSAHAVSAATCRASMIEDCYTEIEQVCRGKPPLIMDKSYFNGSLFIPELPTGWYQWVKIIYNC
jgi:hypothetical protein